MASSGLYQNLSQSQTLAPQMRQSLEILQANTLELSQMIQQAIEFNPTLDDDTESVSLQELDEDFKDGEVDTASQEQYEDLRELSILENRGLSSSKDDAERREHMMSSIVGSHTLQQHLMEQLGVSLALENVKQATEILIGDLDKRGFLETPLAKTAKIFDIPLEVVEDARDLLQGFEPVGVGASNLQESLLIQLERAFKQDSLEYEIVRTHLQSLAKKQFSTIAKSLKTSEQVVIDAAKNIAKLDPAPGSSYEGTSNPVVVPDLIFSRDDNFEWHASLTNEYLPRIKINDVYKSMTSNGKDKGVQSYLRTQIKEGRNIIKALDQRQETILAIGQEIIEKQRDFLEYGLAKLQPLTMNDIADKIGIHATTVSRAVHGKFVKTPFGVMELRQFFASGYTKKSGQTISNAGVKEEIQKIIENEDKSKPLSDAAVVTKLKDQGLKVARRTIAKYREQLGILPSHLRKGF